MPHHPHHPPVFTTSLEVRWSDQDVNGHVNNARVLTLIEEARIKAGHSWVARDPAHSSLPRVVRSISLDFRRPIHYGPELTASVWVSRLGNTSFTVQHELFQEEALCVASEAALVLLDPATGKPTPMPEALRAALEKALTDDAEGSS
ncbi:acyl-CoA thioesterase [Nesterenkonia populi]|uniref:acyl-CoA thioesterase n=1 Tax=Nesterenkonia populi TaxID=1591087 RepID=UPI0011BFA303|nr:thioesterase family protein [Nesterenkonia populi]